MPCLLSASCSWTTPSSFGRGSVRCLQMVSGVEVVAEAGDGRAELMKGLDIHDIASLTRYAVRTGVVALDA